MPRGDRRKRPSTKLIGRALGLFALTTVVIGIGYGLDWQGSYDQEAQQKSADYAKHAANKVKQSCLRVIPAEEARCIKDAVAEYRLETRDKQREYEDLAAQRTSALWTGIMGVAALIGIALSAIGVALVYTTFAETRLTNRIAMKEGARATRRSVASGEETQRQYRPWLALAARADAHLMVHEAKLDFGIIVDVSNVGRTIAAEVVVLADFMLESSVAVRDAVVERLRAKSTTLQAKPDYHRKTIFPGAPVPVFAGLKREPSPQKEIYRIVALVSYRDQATGRGYETWATFDVFKLQGEVYKMIEPRDLPLRKEQIVIHPTGIGKAT